MLSDVASEGSVLRPVQFTVFLMILTQNQNYGDETYWWPKAGRYHQMTNWDMLQKESKDLKDLSLWNRLVFSISKY